MPFFALFAFVDVKPSKITSLMAAIDSPSKDTQEDVEEKRPRPQLDRRIG